MTQEEINAIVESLLEKLRENGVIRVQLELTAVDKIRLVEVPMPEDKDPEKVLKGLGISKRLLGYNYILSAVELIKNDVSRIHQITKKVYPPIAEQYGTTPSRVERAIRHAIEISTRRGNPALQEKIFGYTISEKNGKPTNSEFLAELTDYLR